MRIGPTPKVGQNFSKMKSRGLTMEFEGWENKSNYLGLPYSMFRENRRTEYKTMRIKIKTARKKNRLSINSDWESLKRVHVQALN